MISLEKILFASGSHVYCIMFLVYKHCHVSPQSVSFHLKIINSYGAGGSPGKDISSSGLLIITGTYLELNKLIEVEGH